MCDHCCFCDDDGGGGGGGDMRTDTLFLTDEPAVQDPVEQMVQSVPTEGTRAYFS